MNIILQYNANVSSTYSLSMSNPSRRGHTLDSLMMHVKALKSLSLKVSEIETFMSKQKLPRLKDVTPEIASKDVQLHANDVLGVGRYGTVFKGVFKGGKTVAIKTIFADTAGGVIHLPKPAVDELRREALIMCTLNRPNGSRVFGIVPELGWFVMEYCSRGSLRDVLMDTRQSLSDSDKLRFAAEIATGVAYLHLPEVSIVHGDLKSANVLLASDGGVRLCDFGLSHAKNRSKTLTMAASAPDKGHALTVAWSAPELFKDDPKTFASDVYALAITAWEVFERWVPFGHMPEAAVVSQVLAGVRPHLLRYTPVDMHEIIQ